MSPSSLLLDWYKKQGRTLPWRGTRDPYRILVSEIMLQQTQVPRVIVFYKEWLKTFPTWQRLARATNAEVIRAWSGLGYNRRALVLRNIAQHVTLQGIPKNEQSWRELKGIGPYTSAALACFSLHERAFPIDTNIRRTAGRLLLGIPFAQPKQDERIRKNAEQYLMVHKRFFDIPQALFDLATAICTKNPACIRCPIKQSCPAAKKFLTGKINIPHRSIAQVKETKHRNKLYPDRIYRGRILKLAGTHNGILIKKIGLLIDPIFDSTQDDTWLMNMISRLAKDGLILSKKKRLYLPTSSR